MKVRTLEPVVDRPEEMRRKAPTQIANVGPIERLLTGMAGGILLGLASKSKRAETVGLSVAGGGLVFRALSGYCPGYQVMGLDHAHEHSPAVAIQAQHGYKFEGEVKIHRAPDDIYRFWRQSENLPQIFAHIKGVEALDERRSKWTAIGPLGKEIRWEAEIFSEKPYELIAWRSVKGSAVKTAGSIHFESSVANTGTIVRLSLKYDPPGGKLGAAIAHLFGEDFETEMSAALQKLKEVMETEHSSPANA